jgi:hypothetical protein
VCSSPRSKIIVEAGEHIILHFLDGAWVQHILASYGYAAIFLIVMMESAGVPLPGETASCQCSRLCGADGCVKVFGDVCRNFGPSCVSAMPQLEHA